MLWFDVEKKRYTTPLSFRFSLFQLWFDVEKKRYTTIPAGLGKPMRCGLM